MGSLREAGEERAEKGFPRSGDATLLIFYNERKKKKELRTTMEAAGAREYKVSMGSGMFRSPAPLPPPPPRRPLPVGDII